MLIPARNEEQNLAATLEAAPANQEARFEVIVLDASSTDGTAEILKTFARRDQRVRWESAPSLPKGWCGKQHACHVLAGLARHPLLLFIDADVRLAPDALSPMVHFMERNPAALASGVPRLFAVLRFRQPLGSALRHPLGVLALLAIQWSALVRRLLGRPSQWKGRSYGPSERIQPAEAL